jgi:hypothetical protein
MANKTKTELLEEIEAKNKEIKDLKAEVDKLERYKKYEDMADEIAAMREAFVNSGFSKSESYDMTKNLFMIATNQFLKL